MAKISPFNLQEIYSQFSFVYDVKTGKMIFVSPELLKQLGEQLDSLLEDITAIIYPDDFEYLTSTYKNAVKGEIKSSVDIRLMINQEETWLRIAPFVINQKSTNIILGNVEVISSEINNLLVVQKYTNKKNSVLNILSHDLRGPLGLIKTITQILGKEITENRLQGFLQTISKVVQQSIDMINDLLSREFLDSTAVDFFKKRIDVSTKFREYIEEYRNSEWVAKRVFKFSTSHENIFIPIDEAKFMQVLNNLMTNALKFTKEGGTIHLHLKLKENSLLVIFEDDGIGIPKEYQDSLFDKFTEARRKGLNGEPTVGLGLSIVKTIVEWHGGKIWFDSNVAEGTKFKIELPIV